MEGRHEERGWSHGVGMVFLAASMDTVTLVACEIVAVLCSVQGIDWFYVVVAGFARLEVD